MPNISTVRLHTLIRVQEVCQAIGEYGNIIPFAGGVWALEPSQPAGSDANAELVPERRLTGILVRCEARSFLIDTVVSTVDAHEAVVQDVIFLPLFKNNLRDERQ